MYQNIKKIINISLLSSCIFSAFTHADLYYSAKVAGPVVNIFAVNEQGIHKITENKRWRDLEHHVSESGLIAFSSNRKKSEKITLTHETEDFNIYVLDPATKALTQITKGPAQDQQPKFSPSGSEIAFIRDEKTKKSLVVYNLKSNKEKVLSTTESIYDFSWSPDSSKIIFTNKTKNSASVMLLDVNSATSETLLSAATNADKKQLKELFVGAKWAPNGEQIAYIKHPLQRQQNRALYVYHLATGKSQLISPIDVQVQAPITWSKNSNTLLYSALVNYQQFYDETIHKKVYLGGMHIFSSDLLGKSKKITEGDHLFKRPIFSPDESQITYLYADKLDARTLKVKSMNLDGSKQKTLAKGVAQTATIQWQ